MDYRHAAVGMGRRFVGAEFARGYLLYYSASNAKHFGRIMEFFQCGTSKRVTTFT
jgi:hypothetical protein